MELREYIRVILKSWWLIVPITLLSITVALFFSYNQIPVYEAESSYIAGLNRNFTNADNLLFSTELLFGRQEVFITYCEVMKSGVVRDRALQLMGIDPATFPVDQYPINCVVQPSSNVLLLTVMGPSQTMLQRLNEAIGLAGMERINAQFPLFPLQVMDPVFVVPDPVSPVPSRDAILGGALGIAVSVTMALVLENLRSPLERLEALSIRDPLLNVFNDRYFHQRLSEELNRARIRYRPLSMVFSRVVPNEDFHLLPQAAQDGLMRNVALFIQSTLRKGDLLAYHRKADNFELLLPETPNHEAKDIVTKLHNEIRNQTFRYEQYVSYFTLNSGVVEGSGETLELETMIQQATKALDKARQNGENTMVFMKGAPSPFVLEDAEVSTPMVAEIGEPAAVPSPLPVAATPMAGSESSAALTDTSFGNSAWGSDNLPSSNTFENDYLSSWLSENTDQADLNRMLADLDAPADGEPRKPAPEEEDQYDG